LTNFNAIGTEGAAEALTGSGRLPRRRRSGVLRWRGNRIDLPLCTTEGTQRCDFAKGGEESFHSESILTGEENYRPIFCSCSRPRSGEASLQWVPNTATERRDYSALQISIGSAAALPLHGQILAARQSPPRLDVSAYFRPHRLQNRLLITQAVATVEFALDRANLILRWQLSAMVDVCCDTIACLGLRDHVVQLFTALLQLRSRPAAER